MKMYFAPALAILLGVAVSSASATDPSTQLDTKMYGADVTQGSQDWVNHDDVVHGTAQPDDADNKTRVLTDDNDTKEPTGDDDDTKEPTDQHNRSYFLFRCFLQRIVERSALLVF